MSSNDEFMKLLEELYDELAQAEIETSFGFKNPQLGIVKSRNDVDIDNAPW